MYSTPKGDRILEGAERRLYEESLGMIVDFLADGDAQFGLPAFDQFQHGPKLYALYRSGRALLHPDEPVPERVAYLEAAIATVYQHVFIMVVDEIEEEAFGASYFWRKLVCNGARESESIEEVPEENGRNNLEWELVVECLLEDVLWDRDFEIDDHLDADPESANAMKGMMGIPPNYHTAVPLDPPDDQIDLYVDALKGLTPRGRGEDMSPDDSPDEPTDGVF